MEKTLDEAVEDILAEFSERDPNLVKEVREKISPNNIAPTFERAINRLSLSEEMRDLAFKTISEEKVAIPASTARMVAETIVRPVLRPVLKIRDNALVMEFMNADSEVWRARLIAAKSVLDTVIPAVGRIELKNHPGFSWVGTGWLIDENVIVTNRHVAREFARRDNQKFVFRQSFNGTISCRIDFLEEFERSRALEFEVTDILWIAPTSDADIAFLQVVKNSGGSALSRPIKLSENKPVTDQFVVTIGYPARDDEFPDQDLARKVFGDVYDKKRLAPGQIMESPDDEVLHDCSTLGGNSGSVVLDLETGEAVALHYAGLFPTANFAVPAEIVKNRLRRVLRGEFAPSVTTAGTAGSQTTDDKPKETNEPLNQQNRTSVSPASLNSATFVIPLQLTISFGAPVLQNGGDVVTLSPKSGGDDSGKPADSGAVTGNIQNAVDEFRAGLASNSNVKNVRSGYRFVDDWITDEQVIVVEVYNEAKFLAENSRRISDQFKGYKVEVRPLDLVEKLRSEGAISAFIEERVARGKYRKPTHLHLREVKNEPLNAIFHVSPDSGFPNLKAFIARTESRLTATMYEFEARHISDAILGAISPTGRTLLMVTQKNKEMQETIGELKTSLKKKFDHVWASVGNAISNDTNLLFPKAYHIKVAVRDGKEFWLSSGNWKTSGQPDIDPAGTDSTSWTPLKNKNREWHAVIENESLAKMFEEYIKYDFSEAHRIPLPEAVSSASVDVFVPEIPSFFKEIEAPARYFDPLPIRRPLRIQPLLSPDNYIEFITGMIEEAERRIYVQNQSFNLLDFDDDGGAGNNEQPFYELLSLLRDRQRTHEVKIIFRDSSEFGKEAAASQKRLLERIKKFGFNMDNIKLQSGCHTKGVIVDSERVLIGSHNLTNQGALYNRDASLLVYDSEVARYFESIFLFDWEFLARQQRKDDELPGGARIALPNEATPKGMRRIPLEELLYDFAS